MAPQGIPCLDLDSIDHDGEGDWTEPELVGYGRRLGAVYFRVYWFTERRHPDS